MRTLALILTLVCAALPGSAQRQKLQINAETPEGRMLRDIGRETDEAKKLALMEQFIEKNGKHEGALWVYTQMVPAYTKAGQFDKALETGSKIMEVDPEDLEGSYNTLKAAEGKKDPDAVLQWAVRTSGIARKTMAAPKPADESEAEDWNKRVDWAKDVDLYTQWSLHAMLLQTQDPAKRAALGEALEQLNPEGEYVPKVANQRFLAYRQLQQEDKAVQLAERTLAKDQSNEDMLLVVANSYLEKQKNPDQVLAYSQKILAIMAAKQKPEGLSDADWAAKKDITVGLAHWMTGVTYSNQSKWPLADKALREALPLVKSNPQLQAGALFHLGLSNYRMGKNLEARKFFTQCAAINSAFRPQAQANLKAIR